jgi:hypothetical protein
MSVYTLPFFEHFHILLFPSHSNLKTWEIFETESNLMVQDE